VVSTQSTTRYGGSVFFFFFFFLTENFLNVISGFLESPIGEDGISDKQQAQYHMKNEDAEDSINRGFRNHIRRCKCFCS
jgi:hypothetical protein